MHVSSSSRAYLAALLRAHVVASDDRPQLIRCRLTHDVRLPSFTTDSPCIFEYCQTVVPDDAPPSVRALEPSSLRHAVAIHLIRISATSLTGSITVTATCALSLDSSRAGPRRKHIAAIVASSGWRNGNDKEERRRNGRANRRTWDEPDSHGRHTLPSRILLILTI
ncbi:hypothetical protein B0H13DRAFT_2434787 [Mycena leptocephala]|nr:hypothetical protein B0H13DRAFT_2434787 [Mycena leptocephala]